MIHFFIKEASYMKNKPVCYVPGIICLQIGEWGIFTLDTAA